MELKNKEKRLLQSLKQSLLDRPVPKLAYNKKLKVIKALPPPLIPTEYVAPLERGAQVTPSSKPKPKPRKPLPVPLPRYIPKKVAEKVKNFIYEITPYYKPEAISKFAKELSERKHFKVVVTVKDRALKNYAKSFEVSIISKEDVAQPLFNTRGDVARLLESELSIDRGIKVEVTLRVLMKKEDEDGEVIFDTPYFNCTIFSIINKHQIQIALNNADEEIKKIVAKWLSKGSDWIIEEVQHHYVNIVKYIPLRGSSYLPPPKELRNSMYGLINLKVPMK